VASYRVVGKRHDKMEAIVILGATQEQAEAVRVALLGTPEFSDVRIEEEEPCRKTTFPARWPKRTTEEFPRAP
jgi:hypothetical protein